MQNKNDMFTVFVGHLFCSEACFLSNEFLCNLVTVYISYLKIVDDLSNISAVFIDVKSCLD